MTMEYTIDEMKAAIAKADECLRSCEGINLLYFMAKGSREYEIIESIIKSA